RAAGQSRFGRGKLDGNGFTKRDFTANQACGGAGQSQIPIRRQALVGDKVLTDRGLVGHFIDGSAFVDFVEHANEDRANAEAAEGGELPPKEFALLPGDGGRAARLASQIVPVTARKI